MARFESPLTPVCTSSTNKFDTITAKSAEPAGAVLVSSFSRSLSIGYEKTSIFFSSSYTSMLASSLKVLREHKACRAVPIFFTDCLSASATLACAENKSLSSVSLATRSLSCLSTVESEAPSGN